MERHGLTKKGKQPAEYRIWSQIKQRILNPACPKWPRYGGRKLDMDPRWIDSFSAFFEDMGKRPSKRHSLERIDNDTGYWSWNCKWATKKEQNRNTSANRIINYHGQDYVLARLAEMKGIDRKRLQDRLENGYSVEQAVDTPVEGGRLFIEWNGETHCLSTWARKLGIPYQTLHSRITKLGWTFEQAIAAG
jgi:hypothetical protein